MLNLRIDSIHISSVREATPWAVSDPLHNEAQGRLIDQSISRVVVSDSEAVCGMPYPECLDAA